MEGGQTVPWSRVDETYEQLTGYRSPERIHLFRSELFDFIINLLITKDYRQDLLSGSVFFCF